MTKRGVRTSAMTALGAALLLGTLIWSHPGLSSSVAAQAQQATPGMDHALELSSAFRHVAKQTMPAVVSITTTGRLVTETVNQRHPFGDDEMMRRFFGNHPQFREFMERGQMERGPVERQRRLPGGKGSGFIISPDGVVLTNSHVVRNAEEVIVRLSDGREYTATDIRRDDRSDVAIVRIDVDEQLPYLPLGEDETMEIGDWVLAFGSPFGLHRTVTQGIISAKSRGLQSSKMTQEFLQTDAAINPGNSGGPLVNLQGEVIGINTAISTASGGYDGVGFAIPITAARWVADQLVASGEVERAYLGIHMQQIDAALAEHFDLQVPKGTVVTNVIEGSPAAKGGFQVGDVLLAVDGRKISSSRQLIGIVERLTIGESYTVRVLRDNQEVDLNIRVATRPQDLVTTSTPAEAPAETDEAAGFNVLGLTAQNITAELAEQLGISGSGVVITSVRPDSNAARAGLESGMTITRVGNTGITSVADLEQALEQESGSDTVLLLVSFTHGDETITRFVVVPLEEDE